MGSRNEGACRVWGHRDLEVTEELAEGVEGACRGTHYVLDIKIG